MIGFINQKLRDIVFFPLFFCFCIAFFPVEQVFAETKAKNASHAQNKNTVGKEKLGKSSAIKKSSSDQTKGAKKKIGKLQTQKKAPYKQINSKTPVKSKLVPTVEEITNNPHRHKLSMLLMDAMSGEIILQSNCSEHKYPASLTKIMTIYLAFSALKSGLIDWNHPLITSEHSATQEPSKLGLEPGEQITLKDAIMSLIIRSANDVAVVIAENLGRIYFEQGEELSFIKMESPTHNIGNFFDQYGTHRYALSYTNIEERQPKQHSKIDSKTNAVSFYEKIFVEMMNRKAQEIGMHHSKFINPSGLHDERQKTTAVDMAIMASAIKRDFPNYYKMFSQTTYPYKGKDLCTTNEVTKKYPGAEGLKTGYTKASGFNLITTVKRNGLELIGVVMGGESAQSRNQIMIQMMDLGIKKLSESRGLNNLQITEDSETLPPFLDQDEAYNPTAEMR